MIDEYIKNFYDDKDQNDKLVQILEAKEAKADKYFFSNVLFFTNERDPKKNKTLKNIEAAIKGTNINLVVFVSEEVEYKAIDGKIKISDLKTKYTIDKQSNVDTIVIARLGVQDSEECMECIKELQSWGLFVLNPIGPAKRASNKYTSSVLMERYGIPQPKFTLVSKIDIKDGQESLNKRLKDIYPDVGESKESDKYEYVVKILDGHGGTGVFMVNGKTILSILQAMFAIDEERQLLVQKKEDADGGDIRVHVLTSRTKQKILAAMKRVKISGDFRSNVSLGATAESVKLTPEQEQIALKVAEISGMPWCAVDIMPLVKGSNPEIGDNVVLEYNASPGTDGISEVIGKNFIEVLFDAINDINELPLEPKSIGFIENIEFTINGEKIKLDAKFDTGNGSHSSTIGCDSITYEGDTIIATIGNKTFKLKKHGKSTPKVGLVEEERNTVLLDEIKIGSRRLINVEIALVDNRKKSTPVLINRDIMRKMGYIINPCKKHSLQISKYEFDPDKKIEKY